MDIIQYRRRCATCGVRLTATNYVLRTKRGKRYVTSRCKPCRSQYVIAQKSSAQRVKERERAAQVYQERRAIYLAEKQGVACVDCGLSDYRVLGWYHRDPTTKCFAASDFLARRTITLDELRAELAKCDARCANCQRRRQCAGGAWDATAPTGKDAG